MRLLIFLSFVLGILPSNGEATSATFIVHREHLKKYYGNSHCVIIASTGRSASTMLTEQIKSQDANHEVLKTHLLPPDKCFTGKIIFIFSNPDKAAESAFHKSIHERIWGALHFRNVETADRAWLKKIENTQNQTEDHNLLAYDALGIYEQLKCWLYTQTIPTTSENAQVLAIKYEHLWDENTINEIQNFLDIPSFTLPAQRVRGCVEGREKPLEISIKERYNLGTKQNPQYAAYQEARFLWQLAPPFQYLEITHQDR